MITQTGLLHTHVVENIIQQMLVTVVCEARFDHSLHNAQIFTAAPVYSGKIPGAHAAVALASPS